MTKISLMCKVGVYDFAFYDATITAKRVTVKAPYINRNGHYATRQQDITDKSQVKAIRAMLDTGSARLTWALIGDAIDDPYLASARM